MKTNQILYPVWKATVTVPAMNIETQNIEYKYIVVTKGNYNQ